MKITFPSLFEGFQRLTATKKTVLTLFGLVSILLLISWISRAPLPPNARPRISAQAPAHAPDDEEIQAELKKQWQTIKSAPGEANLVPMPASSGAVDWAGSSIQPNPPMIAHAAELAVATKEFTKSRAKLEEILERHHSYAAKLRMVGQPAGSELTATLRVPSSEFADAVNDLKTLGNVEREEQTADEITQQHADLEARLKNAQNTLARLKDMLQQGWKAGDPASVQRQISAVNGEIARLESERASTARQVTFAQVLFSLREELVPPTESFAAQFRAAAVAGLGDTLSNVSAILLFVISRGPALLLWVVLLYFPSRWMWRKWHSNADREADLAAGA
jgi:Domain of unknown function (DUF4349)